MTGEKKTILINGGSAFIGANFVRLWLAVSDEKIVNIDKLPAALPELATDDFGGEQYHFVRATSRIPPSLHPL